MEGTHNWFTSRGLVRSLYQLLTLVCILLFVSWLYNGAANRRYVQRIYIPADAQYDVVAFGDSLIEGIGAKQGRGFVTLLAERLDIEILNAGKRRDTTRSALARIESDVLRFSPKIVIISLGGNDVLRGIPMEERIYNLQVIINRIRESGAQVILLGPQTDSWNDKHQERIARFAAEEGAAYVPNILEGILFHPKYLFDLVHPNDAGHALIANRVEPVLRAALGRADTLSEQNP